MHRLFGLLHHTYFKSLWLWSGIDANYSKKTRRIRLWHLLLTSCVIKSDLKKFQHISPNIVDLTGSISGEERGKSVATCQYTYLYAVNECSQRERQLEYFYPSPIKASIFKRGIDVINWERTKNNYYLSLFSTFCSISVSNNIISVLFEVFRCLEV